jgi:hypothetical protein
MQVKTNSSLTLLTIFRNQVQKQELNHAKEFFLESQVLTKIVFISVKVLENYRTIFLINQVLLVLVVHLIISERRKVEEEVAQVSLIYKALVGFHKMLIINKV